METIILTVLGGAIASVVMAAVMYTLVWDGFAHGDMIRLLGCDVTLKPKRYFAMGMLLYLITGVALSWFYFMVLKAVSFDSVTISTGFAGAMGFAQGFIMMHFYIFDLGSRHPNAQYKRHWLPLSFAHWFGHIIFGVAIGSMISSYLLYGADGFLLSSVLNLALAGGIMLFAKKRKIIGFVWHRHEPHS